MPRTVPSTRTVLLPQSHVSSYAPLKGHLLHEALPVSIWKGSPPPTGAPSVLHQSFSDITPHFLHREQQIGFISARFQVTGGGFRC